MPTIQPVYVGQRILVEMKFRLNGVLTDPTIVQMTSKSPGGSSATLTYPSDSLTRRDRGFYEASVIVDTPGNWAFRGQAAGIIDAVNETVLTVLPSNVI